MDRFNCLSGEGEKKKKKKEKKASLYPLDYNTQARILDVIFRMESLLAQRAYSM